MHYINMFMKPIRYSIHMCKYTVRLDAANLHVIYMHVVFTHVYTMCEKPSRKQAHIIQHAHLLLQMHETSLRYQHLGGYHT